MDRGYIKYSGSDNNRIAEWAAVFGDLRRQLELIYSQRDTMTEIELLSRLDSFRQQLFKLTEASPAIPSGLYRKIERRAEHANVLS